MHVVLCLRDNHCYIGWISFQFFFYVHSSCFISAGLFLLRYNFTTCFLETVQFELFILAHEALSFQINLLLFSLCPYSLLSLSKPQYLPPRFLSLSQITTPSLNLIYPARLRNSDLLIPYFASLVTLKYSWKFCPNVTSEVSPYLFILRLFASLLPLSSQAVTHTLMGTSLIVCDCLHASCYHVVLELPTVLHTIRWLGWRLFVWQVWCYLRLCHPKFVHFWLLSCSAGPWVLCRWGLHRTGLLSPVGLGRALLGRAQVGFGLWYLKQAEFQTTRCQCCPSYWEMVRARISTPCLVLVELGIQRIWQD